MLLILVVQIIIMLTANISFSHFKCLRILNNYLAIIEYTHKYGEPFRYALVKYKNSWENPQVTKIVKWVYQYNYDDANIETLIEVLTV